MKILSRVGFLLSLFFFLQPSGVAQPQPGRVPPFEFKDGDRVVFLGDTWMERDQAESYIESRILSRLQGKKVIFRNLAWSADTVLGESRAGFDPPEKGFDRLKEQLVAIKPTVVFLGCGMAESFNGEAGLDRFKADLNKLMDTIQEISEGGVRFIICSPLRHENLGPPLPDPTSHNQQLKLYSDALKTIAQERKARFIPLFDILTGLAINEPPLTFNGIHPTSYGYWRLADIIEHSLGLRPRIWRMGLATDGAVRAGSTGITVHNIEGKADLVKLLGEDQFMVLPPAPKESGRTNAWGFSVIQFLDLAPGNYALTIDGEPVAIHTSEQWAEGQPFERGPAYEQAEELRQTVVKKNELFFHRWRPQNQTYLFGFRKYEQGQNAKEIPMFDPLIAKEEEKIFELTKLNKREYLLRKATDQDAAALKSSAPKKASMRPDVIAKEQPLPSFEVAPGLEVSLFAENPDLAKPIQMNFDPQGRLWVASSAVYPQIQPGQIADDKILVLEDTDRDGKADKSTVFADGLLIPTGVEPGDGGAYVANSTELLFFKDTDGDGKADFKRVLLSGFGTEDTHHILHTLRWGHDGQLYMNQSIYIHSHVETPHGVVRLDSGGIWNFRPATHELGVHMKGLINSWGHHFDLFGQSFATDGAGGAGINWVIPQAMYVTYEGARRILGSVSPGNYPKFCGLETVESEHFPEGWHGTFVTCDFRAHRVVRFGISDQDSGYVTKELPDVMRSTNVTFRPIDVKVGPDGALYIADWSNPIIQHGEVDFRDPRRDHEHGRIWRISYKGRPPLKQANLLAAGNTELLENLHSKNGHLRQQSRRVLTERGAAVKSDLDRWTSQQNTEQGQLEALWIYQSLDQPNPALLKKVLAAKDGRVRAAGTRVLSFWRDRTENPLGILGPLVADEHPRVRVEAVRAAAKIPSRQSAELVLRALNKPVDSFLDYAIWLSINDLAEPWVAAVQSGVWKIGDREKQLEFALKAIEPRLGSLVLAKVLAEKGLPSDGSGPWFELIAKAGSEKELALLFEKTLQGEISGPARASALAALNEAARLRKAQPAGDLQRLRSLIESDDPATRAGALRLVGQWKLSGFTAVLLNYAGGGSSPRLVRDAAFESLRELGGTEARDGLVKLAADARFGHRAQAVAALAALDLAKGIPLAIEVLSSAENEAQALDLWRALLTQKGAAAAFTRALPRAGLPPPMVKAGLRAAREGGRNEPNLVLALARNIDEQGEAQNLSPRELKRLMDSIRQQGDPARGEMVYRRQELGCVTCHAIGGVGGKVGPDMTSLGASAQLDYLIESMVFPNRKVKEGYHSLLLETKDETEISGILVRETDEQLIVRDASNREVAVPKNDIRKRTIGGSIMPAGLIDALTEQEQIDLYRFLSELGRPGPFDASRGNVARSWRLMPRTLDLAQWEDEKVLSMDQKDWHPALTLVDGRLPKGELQASIKRFQNRHPSGIYASTRLEVPASGTVRLELPVLEKGGLWIDGKPVPLSKEVSVNLSAGQHTLALRLDANALPEHLRVATNDGTFLNN